MGNEINSYKYLDLVTRQMVKSWVSLEKPVDIPWLEIKKPLSECNVSMLTTGGVALMTDIPFDQQGEKENPWWGDPTHRELPVHTTEQQVNIYHQHIKTDYALEDLNCILPLQRLRELAVDGVIGQAALTHYSIMGYILRPQELLEETVPKIIDKLMQEKVDLLILVPV